MYVCMCVYMYVCIYRESHMCILKNNLIFFSTLPFFLSKGLMTQKKVSFHFENLELNQTNTKKRSRVSLFVLLCIQTKI